MNGVLGHTRTCQGGKKELVRGTEKEQLEGQEENLVSVVSLTQVEKVPAHSRQVECNRILLFSNQN